MTLLEEKQHGQDFGSRATILGLKDTFWKETQDIVLTCLSSFSFTDCLKNNSEGLSNSTLMFLALFNASLTCFEHNLQVLNAAYRGVQLSPLIV